MVPCFSILASGTPTEKNGDQRDQSETSKDSEEKAFQRFYSIPINNTNSEISDKIDNKKASKKSHKHDDTSEENNRTSSSSSEYETSTHDHSCFCCCFSNKKKSDDLYHLQEE